MTLTHRPCGECAALVTPEGCEHWTPPRRPTPALVDNRSGALITAQTLREPHGGHQPMSRLLALGRATLQRAMLTEALADPNGEVTSNDDRGRRNAFTKMLRQGYVERVGQRNSRHDPIRYRITPMGRTIMQEYTRAHPEGQRLPLPLPPRP